MSSVHKATAFAPASVANVAIGFDILGFAVDELGDKVTVARKPERGVTISSITGADVELPKQPEDNTAGRALLALAQELDLPFGFDMQIEKGIPLGSGLGGSAASAVAAVVAGNAVLDQPLPKIELLKFAMQGEAVAAGSRHADNISPSLFGGLVVTVGIDQPRVKHIPVPRQVRAVMAHPHLFLSTKQARSILKPDVPMSDFIWQTAHLAGFICGCYTNDIDLIRASLEDVIIQEQRKSLIPGFDDVRRSALAAGALGCSISGAGPTVFAWALEYSAVAVREAMVKNFARHDVKVDDWIIEINSPGARVIA